TVINKRVVLQQLLADIGNLQVHNMDGGHIDAWLTKRSYKAPSTRNRDVDIVRDFFKWCRARRITKPDHDPLVGVRRAMALPRERIFLQPTQFGELLDAADSGRDRITIAIGLYTFLRTSEITRLRIQHVHIEDPNPKKWRLQVWKPKTGDYDELPVSKPLERELRRWLLDYRGQMGRDLHKDWYLVPAFHKQY